jgi:hypothetical protein
MGTWTHPFHRSRALLAAAIVAATVTGALAQPIRTDLGSYFIFGMRTVNVKNLNVLKSCNTGVNCPQPNANSACGVVSHENSFYADGSQIQGDNAKFTKPGANVFQVFTNKLDGAANVTIRDPGSKPDGSSPLTVPIIGDLDKDGNPSCSIQGGACVPDFGDLAVFCGMPAPFPACDVTKPVLVLPNQDCVIAADSVPGNNQCDLAPGTYGTLTVQNDGVISFDGGAYNFCSVVIGKTTSATVKSPATLNVGGDFTVNNGGTFGQSCGDFTVNANGAGLLTLGRNGSYSMFACAPERTLDLGHNNDLLGRFVGDVVRADSNDRGQCCGGPCTCFDTILPLQAKVGDTVTLSGGCNMLNGNAVRVCGKTASIVTQTAQQLTFIVPTGVSGSCTVELDSGAGTFVGKDTLLVQ